MSLNDKKVNILAIETSCDDTCVSVMSDGKILSNIVFSQIIHKKYGGIVPELSSREHLKNLPSTIDKALFESCINKQELSAIAFTFGPGLEGSLLVGSTYAKNIAFILDKPLIAINHLQAHALAACIDNECPMPFLCLLVSGGNTMIVKVSSFYNFEILSQTVDDAIGEAYDKIAKMLGFEYPGGHFIDYYSQFGNPLKFTFPQVNISQDKFSFSGIKTSFKLFIEEKKKNGKDFIKENINDICASIQNCLLNILIKKIEFFIIKTGIKVLTIGGGVASNNGLCNKLYSLKEKLKFDLFIPKKEYCTDNAAMIAFCGNIKYKNKDFVDLNFKINSRIKI